MPHPSRSRSRDIQRARSWRCPRSRSGRRIRARGGSVDRPGRARSPLCAFFTTRARGADLSRGAAAHRPAPYSDVGKEAGRLLAAGVGRRRQPLAGVEAVAAGVEGLGVSATCARTCLGIIEVEGVDAGGEFAAVWRSCATAAPRRDSRAIFRQRLRGDESPARRRASSRRASRRCSSSAASRSKRRRRTARAGG